MIWLILTGLIVGVLLGYGLCHWRVQPKLKEVESYNEETRIENNKLKCQHEELVFYVKEANDELSHLKGEISILNERKINLSSSIEDLKYQADTAGQEFYNKAMENMSLKLEQSAEVERQKFQKAQQEYENEYHELLKQCTLDYNTTISSLQFEKSELEQSLLDVRSIVDSAVAANKRAYEIAEQSNFYRLILPDKDLEEIEKLKTIIPYMRDPEPLNKVIWKVYYEKPYTDLIGRVVGQSIKTGIYKITNLQNNMCYVGQAVNIADRWKQHIKRGVGAETPTRNKLYPAMMSFGIENFTFEIIEECERSLLNNREDYWQEYFHAKDFGYSIK